MPTQSDFGYLQINAKQINNAFATYNASNDERLNISICNPGEIIYFGFKQTNNDVYFRIKDPSGNIVFGPQLIPGAGSGFIANYNEAVAGPQPVAGATGYTPLIYTPVTTGNHYIEFNYGDPVIFSFKQRTILYTDITVATAGNIAIDGRLWSKKWGLTTSGGTRPFVADMYIYSNDSMVSKINFNGMQPFGFTVSANSTGSRNTGNPVEDRNSTDTNAAEPEFMVFLNDPDESCYPSGTPGVLMTATVMKISCSPERYCFNVETNKSGLIEVLIDLNGTSGYDAGTSDVLLTEKVTSGVKCISWDGRDGLGTLVSPGSQIDINTVYYQDPTHVPLFDVENNANGFLVEMIRPTSGPVSLYWDDSNFSIGNRDLTGCSSSTGCHTWSNNFGNIKTLNTWWFASQDEKDYKYTIPDYPVANFDDDLQCGELNVNLTDLSKIGDTTIALWDWNFGDGSTENTPNTTHKFDNFGTYVVSLIVTDQLGCKDTVYKTLTILPEPVIDVSTTRSGCVPVVVNFTNQSDSTNSLIDWTWHFGDGQTSKDRNPTHTYTKTGNYSVSITMKTPNRCIVDTTLEDYIVVTEGTNAVFDASPLEAELLSAVDVNFIHDTSGLSTWGWNFGEGTTSSEANPSHEYTEDGEYLVTLTITDTNGCTSSFVQSIVIIPKFTFFIPNTFSPNNDLLNDKFNGTGIGISNYELWIFDRWGLEVHHTDSSTPDTSTPWNGNFNNGSNPAPEDAYIYLVQIKDKMDKKHEFAGQIVLIR